MKIKSALFRGSAAKSQQFPEDGRPEVAFVGRSNVGKSSLINCLVNRKKLAKTSRTPGKTQLVNFFLINDLFYLVDLPGFGYAKVPTSVRQGWRALLESYFTSGNCLKGVAWLFDIRRTPTELDYQTLEWLTGYRIPFRLVFTKADKFSTSKAKTRGKKLARDFAVSDWQTFSIIKHEGKADLWRWIAEAIGEGSKKNNGKHG